MKQLPYDLQKDLNALPGAENRLSKKMLTIAVYVLSGVVGVLFAMVIRGNSTSISEKDKQLVQKDVEMLELKKEVKEVRSLYTDCLLREARKENEDIIERHNTVDEKAVTLRIQDSILNALNSRKNK